MGISRASALALLISLAATASAVEPRLERYVAELEDPGRDEWQQPERVVKTLALRPGMVVADVGAGTGYFARRFGAAVAPGGKVLALDVEPGMLDELRRRAPDAKNVETRVVPPGDPGLAPKSVDVVFICNTGHHLPDRVRYYGNLRQALRPGGRLVLVDFHKRDLPVGPPVKEKLSRDETLHEAEEAGFRLRAGHDILPYQYFLELVPK
ncbi:MAG TPA: class I SAM-dependent methyltransferase [Candidatus Binatia bacterium]|nr:class I SAM-dependent methyltransferase [Candidatus Binatia bacterium]